MAQLAETARRIGRVYGLLAAAFVLFLVVITLLAQFGLPDRVVAVFVVMITVVTYAGIGLITRTLSLAGFYLADRGVPAGFNGMATAAAALALPFVGLAGAFLADRFLGLAIAAGLLAGVALGEVAGEGEEEGEGVLADAGAVRAAGVGEEDVAGDQLGDAGGRLDAGAGGLEPAELLGGADHLGGDEAVDDVGVGGGLEGAGRVEFLDDLEAGDGDVAQDVVEVGLALGAGQQQLHGAGSSPARVRPPA